VELVPTGGVSLATAAEFLEAGAFALGVGADLVNPKAIREGHPRRLPKTHGSTWHCEKFHESQTQTAG